MSNQYFVKIKNWIKEDLKRTDKSLLYLLTGVRIDKMDEQTRRRMAETNEIANYNYHRLNKD